MPLLRLEAEIEDLLFLEGNETDEQIRTKLCKIHKYLADAFNCKVESTNGGKYCYFILHLTSHDQVVAVSELLDLFTIFDAKIDT